MTLVFISSTGDHAGQTLFTWAMARGLVEKGLRVGLLKPFGNHPVQIGELWTDSDAVLFKEVLHLEAPLGLLCPFPGGQAPETHKGHEEMVERIRASVCELSGAKDVVLLIGSEAIFFDLTTRGIPETSIVSALDAHLVLLHRAQEPAASLYSIFSVCSLLRERVKGIILNRVPLERLEALSGQLIPLLAEKGIPITAVIPEDPILSSWSLREVLEILDGQILWGEERLDNPVGAVTVGSTYLQGELLLFKRVYNKIVLLEPSAGGEGPPPHLRVAGIILTGGIKPPQLILEAVRKADTPLMIVRMDVFAARELLEASPPRISARDEAKVRRLTELMDREGALERLFHSLGLT